MVALQDLAPLLVTRLSGSTDRRLSDRLGCRVVERLGGGEVHLFGLKDPAEPLSQSIFGSGGPSSAYRTKAISRRWCVSRP